MLAQICALAIAQGPAPKDVDELIQFVWAAYSKQTGYRDEWTMTGRFGEGTLVCKRTLDAPRERFETTNAGQLYLLFGSDGKADFTILYPSKTYYQEPIPKPGVYSNSHKHVESHSFTFEFDAAGIVLYCDPPLKIASVKPETVEGKPMRRVIAQAVNPDSGGKLEVNMLFWPDAWIPTDIVIQLTRKGEQPELLEHAASKIQTGLKFGPELFAIDPGAVKDFTKVTRDEMFKSFGGGG